MFGIGKKKEDVLYATTGKLVPLAKVSDPVFAQKMMGDGYAITPQSGKIFAPVNGVIKTIFPTKHAMAIETNSGLEVLIHMGFDTVELEGKPFTNHVKLNQKVNAGTLISEIDLDMVKQAKMDTTISVIYTNMNILRSFPEVQENEVEAKEKLGRLVYK